MPSWEVGQVSSSFPLFPTAWAPSQLPERAPNPGAIPANSLGPPFPGCRVLWGGRSFLRILDLFSGKSGDTEA